MEELAKLLAKANAEVERLTERNAELERMLAVAAEKYRDRVTDVFDELHDVKEIERARSAFLARIINRPLKRAREIAAEDVFDIQVVYEDGKDCRPYSGTEALNSREALVSVVNGVIMGHDAINRDGVPVWVPAAVFPYRI